MEKPLADRIRPENLEDVVGQAHLLQKGKLLRNVIESGHIPNMIFYGPSGTGKTTLANIAAKRSHRPLYRLNATTASVSDVKRVIEEANGLYGTDGVLLYLDEIQNFNKKQQQSLLEYMENGKVTLIASTTENPYFYIYNAILSRSSVFEFYPVEPKDIEAAIYRGIRLLNEDYHGALSVTDEAIRHLSYASGGDVRKALNALELLVGAAPIDSDGKMTVDIDAAVMCTGKRAFRFDRDGDSHYDVLSAFQKSIRGSDPDAAVHYLARLIEGGDLPSVCRRLLVIAAEDIGLAYPQAIAVTKACTDAALQLGFPEAQIPLAEAVILLATAPKSNSAAEAIGNALSDLAAGHGGEVPAHLRDAHYKGAAQMGHGEGYRYPHDYPNHYTEQQYLPDTLRGTVYYVPGENKAEQSAKEYWSAVKKQEKKQKNS